MTSPPVTPDGRYIVVRGRLWRRTSPNLSEPERQKLVNDLMTARRAVRDALGTGDRTDVTKARAAVQAAKVGLGERGPVWWPDGKDFNRHLAKNTPYADWYASLGDGH